ncbi:MAG TPA: PAS domain S-box protein, partial [Chitinophagaceae bacterium]
MNKFFRRLPLATKLLLLTLVPIALIVYLSINIYRERAARVQLYAGYIDRINLSTDISALIDAMQTERRYSFVYAVKKDLDSRAQMEIQRPVTDLAIKKLEDRRDSTMKNFRSYTFLSQLNPVRAAVDRGTTGDSIMQYYTTSIFRLNTLNVNVPVPTNTYLKPVFTDLEAQSILTEMVTYLGIIRANFYNVLYTRKNALGTLYGLAGVNEIFKSYQAEFEQKAPETVKAEYHQAAARSPLSPTLAYITSVFSKFAFDSSYTADNWWKLSGEGTDAIKTIQRRLSRNIQASVMEDYQAAITSQQRTLILLAIAVSAVLAVMFYTAHVLTQILNGLNKAAGKIAVGSTDVKIDRYSGDVIGSLSESIARIDRTNREVAEAADAIGRGNFDVQFEPRGEDDILGNAIVRMKNNLYRFTMEIERNQEQFRQVADSAPVMIWMTDPGKQCNFVNKAWLAFTGRKRQEELGYGWIEGMYPDDYAHSSEVFEDAFAERNHYSLEYRFRRHDGEYRWLNETGAPLYTSEGKFQGYIGSCIDITDMKMLEQRKDDFIRMASHELKTPVTSIKGYIQLLLTMFRDYADHPQEMAPALIQSSLTTIDRQIVKLNRLMSELLDLSRIETGKLELDMQAVDIDNLVRETVEDVQQITKHHITISSEGSAKVIGDKDRLAQVLLNILTNAIKYSPKTQSIEVQVSQPDDASIAISVADHGIGIDKS